MSWDAYITHLMQNGSIGKAAILGSNDGSHWAVSPGMEISASRNVNVTQDDLTTKQMAVNERELILEAFATKGEMTSQCGLFVNGEKYMITTYNEDAQSIYFAGKNQTGGCMTKTNQTI